MRRTKLQSFGKQELNLCVYLCVLPVMRETWSEWRGRSPKVEFMFLSKWTHKLAPDKAAVILAASVIRPAPPGGSASQEETGR